jgi:hypothetical protein
MRHSSTPLDLSAKFGPKVGSWECDSYETLQHTPGSVSQVWSEVWLLGV